MEQNESAKSESLDFESDTASGLSDPCEKMNVKVKLRALINTIRMCLRLRHITKPGGKKPESAMGAIKKKGKGKTGELEATGSTRYINPTMFFYYESDVFHSLSNINFTDRYGVKVLSDFAIQSRDVIALFFSSIRCEKCNQLVPVLKNLYEEARMAKKRFEIVSVSYDSTREEMMSWLRVNHIGWYGVESEDFMREGLIYSYEVLAVPHIVVVDNKGNTITRSGVDEILQMGLNVLVTWF